MHEGLVVLFGFNMGASPAVIEVTLDKQVSGVVAIGGEAYRHRQLLSRISSRPVYLTDFGFDLPSDAVQLCDPEKCNREEIALAIDWLKENFHE